MRNPTHPPLGPLTIAALLAGCWLLVGMSRSDDTLPKGFDVGRYQSIWERNPFTLVTPSVGGPASPFSKMILVNWLHDKGKDILFVEDTETNEVTKVTKEEGTNSDRLRLIEVVPNKNPSLVFAKLTNGREEGIVKFKFDQAQNNQVFNPNLALQRLLPGQMGPNTQQFNGQQFNRPGVPPRNQAPQNPQVAGQRNFQPNPNAPDAQEIRRRRMLPTPAQNPVPQNNVPQNNAQQNVQQNFQQNNFQQNNNAGAESSDDDDDQ